MTLNLGVHIKSGALVLCTVDGAQGMEAVGLI
jgi:hypothetical protein